MLAELQKLWKDMATYVKDICNRKEELYPFQSYNNAKFEFAQAVIVRNHTFQTLELKYLTDYRVLKYLMKVHYYY